MYQRFMDRLTGNNDNSEKSAALMNMVAASKAADGMALDQNDLANLQRQEEEDWDIEPEGSPADFETAFDIDMNMLTE